MIGIRKPMPSVFGYEYCSRFLKWVPYIVQYEDSAAFQNEEGFVHLEVSVDRNACADRHLLSPQGQIVRTCGKASLDEDVAMVAKMNDRKDRRFGSRAFMTVSSIVFQDPRQCESSEM